MKYGKICDDSDSSKGRNIKLTMILNLYMMPLNKILEINYTYGSLKQPTTTNILWRVTVYLFIRGWVIEMDYLQQKENDQKAKIPCKGNEGVHFGGSCN